MNLNNYKLSKNVFTHPQLASFLTSPATGSQDHGGQKAVLAVHFTSLRDVGDGPRVKGLFVSGKVFSASG